MKSPLSLNTGTVDILLVDLPYGAFSISNDIKSNQLEYVTMSGKVGFSDCVILPKGNYKIIGWSDSLTEEQANSLIGKVKHLEIDVFPDFTNPNRFYSASLPSWHSFLSANNITERKYILVKIK